MSFVFGKSRVVLKHQQNWPIAKKELVAAVIAVDLMQSAFKALLLPECTKSFWCDSKVVMQWISNPDLRLDKFTWRRTNYILLHSHPEEWQFCPTLDNPADVATRPLARTVSDRHQLWLQGPEFLTQPEDYSPRTPKDVEIYLTPTLKIQPSRTLLDLIQTAPDWYTLKKRAAYLTAFSEYIRQKVKRSHFKCQSLIPHI